MLQYFEFRWRCLNGRKPFLIDWYGGLFLDGRHGDDGSNRGRLLCGEHNNLFGALW